MQARKKQEQTSTTNEVCDDRCTPTSNPQSDLSVRSCTTQRSIVQYLLFVCPVVAFSPVKKTLTDGECETEEDLGRALWVVQYSS